MLRWLDRLSRALVGTGEVLAGPPRFHLEDMEMLNAPWYWVAKQYEGLRETPGGRHNRTIVQMFAEVGHPEVKDDETSWCAAFVGACLERAGFRSTRSLLARSYLNWGRDITIPTEGCIVVLKRGETTWQGHVGFLVRVEAPYVRVLGGNQANAVTTQKFSGDRVLGYRWPLERRSTL